ncbi:uncharacterized protein CcaverHIS019_0600380 [Cutaneotrichosporon cavernicola]|uniref:BTB domain-containing protein n=1 Tax=Cutaneotrichosporon cavernicola TaxID=279322 RepID=A0AA48L7V4_9TREE|nr:uncharacterized protein CcaverHIS019_0600380 [Cutaneotrichosporon cavernicola]BEI93579.1 hypothetical protein CcaverHIS019_0600380 [Cutaneotrichosporon cavernicola]BEJ01356.1 hypothetical protein CcaverHIS631_0600380 [Cutaneotrichosporon cavernicola]BEJ09123.1 hypothetical protein CcaverHIS641_0600380 [Cutaneotrichosporon cavernicola]
MSNKSESESSTESVWDDDNWTEGDFEIITSDNVRFRVPSFHLYSSSSVFRNAHSVAGESDLKIVFMDPLCETAAVIHLYLSLVVEGRLVTLYNLPFVKELAIFLDKYGCDQARSFMCSRIENAVLKGEIDAHAGFLVAANASNIPLCRLILVRQANHTWKRDKGRGSDELIAGMAGKNVWDSNYWPASTWNSGIPQAYLFALARAYGSCDMSSDNSLADEFEHYLNLITD